MESSLLTPQGRLPRYARARHPVEHRLTMRDQDILTALGTFPYLTAEQVARLVFGGVGSLSYARDRLKRLYHARLVDRVPVQQSLYGSPLPVYTLQKRNPVRRDGDFMAHTLAV